MTTQQKFMVIIKKAIAEMAIVDCTATEYLEGLHNAKDMLNAAALGIADEVKAECAEPEPLVMYDVSKASLLDTNCPKHGSNTWLLENGDIVCANDHLIWCAREGEQ